MTPTGGTPLPSHLARRLEHACDRFEAAWSRGQSPRIEDFLTGWDEPERTTLVRELLQLEAYHRSVRGETCRLADYVHRFPGLDKNWLCAAGAETAAPSPPAGLAEPGDTPGLPAVRDDTLTFAGDQKPAETCSADGFQPGQSFGQYELIERVAHGGMGAVFKARHRKLDRVVALKMILAGGLASPSEVQRFRSEAEAAARLDHPNIVPIYDVGEHDGRPYFSMAFVDGTSLAARLRQGPLDPREAAKLVADLAAAVQVAHDAGVIHRDLKPGNVLLDKTGRPKLTDFGLAKLMDRRSDVTGSGQLLGTPSYMAPEQAAETATAVGPAADVYGLGALLFALLTGRPPFQAATALDTVVHVLSADPPRPTVLNPAVPRDLETICLKCLEKPAAKRYPSAAALRDDLGRFLEDRPIRARPAGTWERGLKWVRRRPTAALALGLVLFLAVGGTIAAFLFKAQRDDAQRARRDATDQLRQALVARASAGRTGGRAGRRFDSLDALVQAAHIRPGSDLRNEAIACLTLADVRVIREWPTPPGGARNFDCDDAFVRYVQVSMAGRISVRRFADDVEEMEVPSPGRGEIWPQLSRDGRYLRLGTISDHRVQVWRVDGRDPKLLLPDVKFKDPVLNVFRPDSRRFATADDDGGISLYDLPSGQLIRQLPNTGRIVSLAYDPAGRRIAAAGDDGVQILDAETGERLAELGPIKPAASAGLAWHPRGDRLACVGADLKIRLWEVATRRLLHVLEGCRNGGVIVRFNRAGDLLASTDWDGRLRLWNPDTGRLLFSTLYNSGVAHFSADDRWLAGDLWDGKIRLWEVAPGREYRTLISDWRPIFYGGYAFVISPDDRWLAVTMENGIVLWDANANRQIGVLPTGNSASLQFDASGALIATVQNKTSAFRWPVTPAGPNAIRLGPAERLPVSGPLGDMAVTADGRVVAAIGRKAGVVINRDRPDQIVQIGPLADARRVAVSPDGRVVVTGDFHPGGGLKVWDADGQKPVRQLRSGQGCWPTFNPDGTLLASRCYDPAGLSNDGQVWEVGTWNEVYHCDGWPQAFSPDGAMLAVETGQGVVQLLHSRTGAEIARLEDPNLDRIAEAHFTADGAALFTCTHDGTGIRVWDLRQIRSQLAERGLDWGLPPYPPAPVRPTPGEPLRIEVVG